MDCPASSRSRMLPAHAGSSNGTHPFHSDLPFAVTRRKASQCGMNDALDREAHCMKRRHLVELEDLTWWPRVFRDAETDYLATALRVMRTYSVMVPRLAAGLKECGRLASDARHPAVPVVAPFLDLCGAGGAGRDAVRWDRLLPAHVHSGRDEGDGGGSRRGIVQVGGRDRIPTRVGDSDSLLDGHSTTDGRRNRQMRKHGAGRRRGLGGELRNHF